MCGIAGQYCFGTNTPDKDLLKRMSEILKHRGPDGEGSYFNNKIGLVHRRLAIIDLSENAHQPMFNEDGSVVIVFNGEIYNYVHLRDILKKLGHIFKSESDTEVIIHAYEEWGIKCLQEFNGMWAFALWDDKKKLLFCARDRFGIKPFYYTFINNSIIFASEIKSLLEHPAVGKEANRVAIDMFLSSGALDFSHMTMFNGIYQIQPSRGFVITENGMRDFQYYDYKVSSELKSKTDDKNISDNLLRLLNYSVKRHLQSDVPIGTCLSGGLDSSTIVKLIKSDKQKTFSAQFKDKRFDESEYCNYITSDKSIDSYSVEPSPLDIPKDLENLIYYQDEPFGSLSIYAQYCVMRLAQGKVKVLLDGQGADELFAGYLTYQPGYIKELLYKKEFKLFLKELVGSIYHHKDFYLYVIKNKFFRSRKFALNYTVSVRYKGSLSNILYNEMRFTNLQSLLHFEDRNSMAFSIESRVPYLDIWVVNFVSGLSYDQKIRNGVTKISLRNAVKGIVPEKIRMRMDKMGFVTPEEVWMKNDLKDFVIDIITSESFNSRRLWDTTKIRYEYQKFLEGKTGYTPEFWRVVCVELWLRKFFDNRVKI